MLVATANDGQAHTFTVTGRRFTATIPDGGTETFVWNTRPPSITSARVRRKVVTRRARQRIRYTLSDDALMTIAVKRRRGRRYHRVLSLTPDGTKGHNLQRLPTRRNGHRLRPGRYRVLLTAIDPATGDKSRTVRRSYALK